MVFLNVCAIVIRVFCLIFGMKVNWVKVIAICSFIFVDCLLRRLGYVRVL